MFPHKVYLKGLKPWLTKSFTKYGILGIHGTHIVWHAIVFAYYGYMWLGLHHWSIHHLGWHQSSCHSTNPSCLPQIVQSRHALEALSRAFLFRGEEPPRFFLTSTPSNLHAHSTQWSCPLFQLPYLSRGPKDPPSKDETPWAKFPLQNQRKFWWWLHFLGTFSSYPWRIWSHTIYSNWI